MTPMETGIMNTLKLIGACLFVALGVTGFYALLLGAWQ